MLAIPFVLISAVNNSLLATELPNVNNNATFLTYNDTAYGISIEYPANWQIDESVHQHMLSFLQNLTSSESQIANGEQNNAIKSKISEALDAFGLESVSDVFSLNPDKRAEFLQKMSQLLSEERTQVIVGINSPFEDESDALVENLNIVVANISELSPISLGDYVDGNIEGLKTYTQDFAIIQPPTEITIDGNPAMTLVHTGRGPLDTSLEVKFLNVFLIKKNTGYILTFTTTPESYSLYASTFEKMLKSFKITD